MFSTLEDKNEVKNKSNNYVKSNETVDNFPSSSLPSIPPSPVKTRKDLKELFDSNEYKEASMSSKFIKLGDVSDKGWAWALNTPNTFDLLVETFKPRDFRYLISRNCFNLENLIKSGATPQDIKDFNTEYNLQIDLDIIFRNKKFSLPDLKCAFPLALDNIETY